METGSWTARPGDKVITELHRRPYELLMDRFLPRQAHHGGPVAEASANSFLSKLQLIQEKKKKKGGCILSASSSRGRGDGIPVPAATGSLDTCL